MRQSEHPSIEWFASLLSIHPQQSEFFMEKKIFLWVLALTLIGLTLAILLPGGRQSDPHPKLPWDIKLDGLGGF